MGGRGLTKRSVVGPHWGESRTTAESGQSPGAEFTLPEAGKRGLQRYRKKVCGFQAPPKGGGLASKRWDETGNLSPGFNF